MGIFARAKALWNVRIKSRWEMYRARPVLVNSSRSATAATPRQQIIRPASTTAGAAIGRGLRLKTQEGEKINKNRNIPTIFLTARDEEDDIVKGLELGADDYITKPFSLMVLRARMQKVLREKKTGNHMYEIGELQFDFHRMHFYRKTQEIELSKTEQKLLKMLVENRGHTLTREVLINEIWTDHAEYVDENALSVSIKRLRDKIENVSSKPEYIQTVYGIGYTWKEPKK